MLGLKWLKWWHLLVGFIIVILLSSHSGLEFLSTMGGLGLLFLGVYGIYYLIKNRRTTNIENAKEMVDLATKALVLNSKEILHLSATTILTEERAVRSTYGGAVRVAKGVYIGSSKSSSHGQLKAIDKGVLSLTNQRLIFNGSRRSMSYPLSKIDSIKEYSDAIGIAVSNKQKISIFSLKEPAKWAEMIRKEIN